MDLNITITLNDDDIQGGITVDEAITRLFPQGLGDPPVVIKIAGIGEIDLGSTKSISEIHPEDVDAQELDAAVRVSVDAAGAVAAAAHNASVGKALETVVDEASAGPDVEAAATDNGTNLDSSGVPWSSNLHSGNHKQYTSGAEKGRWMWKRGGNKETQESEALALAAQFKTAAPVAATPATAAVPTVAVVPGAVVSVATDRAPAAVAVPVAENLVKQDSPAVAGWDWGNFLPAMTTSGATAAEVLAITTPDGVTTIAELAKRPDAMAKVAAALGFEVPTA